MNFSIRIGIAASLIVGAASHAYLYIHGYRNIPIIGTAFLIQASACFALALLLVAGGPVWVRWAGAAVASGSLVAFVLSRTVGLVGFSERGWNPSPHAAISVAAEAMTVLLWAAPLSGGLGRGPFSLVRLLPEADMAFSTRMPSPRAWTEYRTSPTARRGCAAASAAVM